mgnify:CR=1 FL=1
MQGAINMTQEFSVYSNFNHASLNLSELEAIDYYLAKEISDSITFSGQYDNESSILIFHLVVALSRFLRNGNTCLELSLIANTRFGFSCDDSGFVTHQGYVFPSIEVMQAQLQSLNVHEDALIVFQSERLYLRRYFNFENEVKIALEQKIKQINEYDYQQVTSCLSHLFPEAYNNNQNATHIESEEQTPDWQLIAVANALNKNFSVIAGGPGTGKTYTVTKLLAAFIHLNQSSNETEKLNIVLTAPTGKAAQRLSESIIKAREGFRGAIDDKILNELPTETKTLHRLLGVIPNSPNFKANKDNPLNIDVLLIDEVSMVDIAMFARILRALPSKTKLILLGDADQLPSVAAGSLLTDIAPKPHQGYSTQNIRYLQAVLAQGQISKSSEKQLTTKRGQSASDYVTFLIKSRRFDGEGVIGKLATSVIAGNANSSWQILNSESSRSEQFPILMKGATEDWLPALLEYYYKPLFDCDSPEAAFAQLSKFRLLCSTRQGEFGVQQLNEYVTQLLNPFQSTDTQIFHAQPIMINQNDYNLGLYNGDVGIIWRHRSGHLMAVFEGEGNSLNWVIPSRLPSFETVYAMTIHKTQGSEFGHVAMVLPNQQENKLLSRELIYTGITRAKDKISIACKENVWRFGVDNKVQRSSGLFLETN